MSIYLSNFHYLHTLLSLYAISCAYLCALSRVPLPGTIAFSQLSLVARTSTSATSSERPSIDARNFQCSKAYWKIYGGAFEYPAISAIIEKLALSMLSHLMEQLLDDLLSFVSLSVFGYCQKRKPWVFSDMKKNIPKHERNLTRLYKKIQVPKHTKTSAK